MMDVENLDEKQDFDELPDTYIIFITENDYFNAGKPVYKVERKITTLNNKSFNDGNHIIYVNGQYRGNSPLGDLMHDFFCNEADDMYYGPLADKTRYLKKNTKGVDTMCEVMEELRLETKKETAFKMFKGKEPLEKVANYNDVSIDIVKTWFKEFSATIKKSCI